MARVSRRIRRWRAEQRLTLLELAERGGLATSTVQKVETGQMMPSLAVLLKLAHGLGRHVAELLDEETPLVDVFHTKGCEREVLAVRGDESGDEGGGEERGEERGERKRLVAERLTGNLVKSAIETWLVQLEAGASSGSDPIRYDGEQIVICEGGTVTFRFDHTEYELQPGDSLHFRADIPHAWCNNGHATARFSITGTMPVLFRQLMQARIASVTRGTASERPRMSLVG